MPLSANLPNAIFSIYGGLYDPLSLTYFDIYTHIAYLDNVAKFRGNWIRNSGGKNGDKNCQRTNGRTDGPDRYNLPIRVTAAWQRLTFYHTCFMLYL